MAACVPVIGGVQHRPYRRQASGLLLLFSGHTRTFREKRSVLYNLNSTGSTAFDSAPDISLLVCYITIRERKRSSKT